MRAQDSKEFIKVSGYSSEKGAALHEENDGNIAGMQITYGDIHRAFDLYRRSAAAVRRKTTRKKLGRVEADDAPKDSKTNQALYSDVIRVRQQVYLTMLLESLQLVITSNIYREETEICCDQGETTQSDGRHGCVKQYSPHAMKRNFETKGENKNFEKSTMTYMQYNNSTEQLECSRRLTECVR